MRAVEKRLRERIKYLEARVAEIEQDRDVFRRGLASDLRNAIRIHGENKYWNMPSMIETFAQRLQRVKWFSW